MTTLIYKNLLNRYLLDTSFESSGDGVTIQLCEPIDAKIAIGTKIHRVDKGICRIKELPSGEILPKLYTGTGLYELESFVYHSGVATPNRDRSELIAELFGALDTIEERLKEAEREIVMLNEKVSRRISLPGYCDTAKNKN